MTNLEFIKKAFDDANIEQISEITEFFQNPVYGICGKCCPYQKECDENCSEGKKIRCLLPDEVELKMWLDSETKFE